MNDPLYCPIILEAPCLKPEVWAAFAQAVLSALAIYISVRLANRESERRAAAHTLVVTTLVYRIREHVRNYQRLLLESATKAPVVTDTEFKVILRLRDQLNSVSFQEIGSPRIIEPITDVNACLDDLVEAREVAVSNAIKTRTEMDPSYAMISYALDVLNSAHARLACICEQYRQRGLLQVPNK